MSINVDSSQKSQEVIENQWETWVMSAAFLLAYSETPALCLIMVHTVGKTDLCAFGKSIF